MSLQSFIDDDDEGKFLHKRKVVSMFFLVFFGAIAVLFDGVAGLRSPPSSPPGGVKTKEIVLISGFESFNVGLYKRCAEAVGSKRDLRVSVFSDKDLSSNREQVEEALSTADAFVGSLLFDFEACEWLLPRTERVETRLVFECATELMSQNRVGDFQMGGKEASGPPPAVKKVLGLFGSNREEDKLQGYLKLLKIGPELLSVVPGDKALGLRTWLTLYRYWNEGGQQNVESMLSTLDDWLTKSAEQAPPLVEFPAIGLVHPDAGERVFSTPSEYLNWRYKVDEASKHRPKVAVLLYRKHVLTEQPYIPQLIRQMERSGVTPVPIFIAGVEAHTIVRDLLTSQAEIDARIERPSTYDRRAAARVDGIVNTIGFPLVGGPAGSMAAGRDATLAESLLTSMDVPYVVATPLLLQDIRTWQQSGVTGLQSVVLYALPELDGAIDAVVLGGLAGETVALVPERVRKLSSRLKKRIALKQTSTRDIKVAIVLYGYPPNIGAVGTAALLNVPESLDNVLKELGIEQNHDDEGGFGEAIVAALSVLSTPQYITNYRVAEEELLRLAKRAKSGDKRVAAALSLLHDDETDGLVAGVEIVSDGISRDDLDLHKYMRRRLDDCWPETREAPGVGADGKLVVSGLLLANRVFVTMQPLLGYEGDPTRLLFDGENRLTPHPQYVAFYERLKRDFDACVHFGTHGTVEWLPGKQLGNDAASWSDELIGDLPNFYVYASNNPSESILAKRRGYATILSHATPPYERSGLYLELVKLKELIDDDGDRDLILEAANRTGLLADVPFSEDDPEWQSNLRAYLLTVTNRLFSSGLRVLGSRPSPDQVRGYLEAYSNNDALVDDAVKRYSQQEHSPGSKQPERAWWEIFFPPQKERVEEHAGLSEEMEIASRLGDCTEEVTNLVRGLAGGYVPAGPGGDLLRDGVGVLPTGRNIHALDPYRMPSESAWVRGRQIADKLIEQHRVQNNGAYPETIAVALWGLDAIKTRGESVAIAVALAGGYPYREGTGRIVRFELTPLQELGRPRVDVLMTLSGIFRDSFENVVLLLDDLFERCAAVDDEPSSMNFVKKHSMEFEAREDEKKPAARLFSNPPGDYGSLVNDQVVSTNWEEQAQLGETWASRNSIAYGRGEEGATVSRNRAGVLNSLLQTTDVVVQQISDVEYGLTDIQEYYANTGALKVAVESRKSEKVRVSIVESFDSSEPEPKDLEEVLRLEYRSKLLNPKWADAMLSQGGGGAFEVSTRMTAALGWAATSGVDGFVFDQAAERYVLDEDRADKLRKLNPEAYRNIIARLLEANSRGLWEAADDSLIEKLQDMYADADDTVEGVY